MSELIEIRHAEWLAIETPGDVQVIELPVETIELLEIPKQGPAGPPGMPGPSGGSAMLFTASGAIGGHRVLALDAANQVIYAGNDIPGTEHKIIGMSLNAAAPGGTINVVRSGEVIEPSWGWNTTLPVYLGVNGLLTQTPPAAPAAYSLIVGFPTSPTGLFMTVREPINII